MVTRRPLVRRRGSSESNRADHGSLGPAATRVPVKRLAAPAVTQRRWPKGSPQSCRASAEADKAGPAWPHPRRWSVHGVVDSHLGRCAVGRAKNADPVGHRSSGAGADCRWRRAPHRLALLRALIDTAASGGDGSGAPARGAAPESQAQMPTTAIVAAPRYMAEKHEERNSWVWRWKAWLWFIWERMGSA